VGIGRGDRINPYDGMNYQGSSWTDERVERLKALWAGGLSASQIAAILGGVTRNAVIGKADRLKLDRRAKPAPKPTRTHAPGVPKSIRYPVEPRTLTHRPHRGDLVRKRHSRRLDPGLAARPAPLLQSGRAPVRLADVDDASFTRCCRYILGEPAGLDTLYCGAPIAAKSLCAHHHHLCYVKVDRLGRPIENLAEISA